MIFPFTTFAVFLTITGAAYAALFNNEPSKGLVTRGGTGGEHCIYPVTYNITSQTLVQETPVQITGVQVGPDPAGGSISAGYTYSKSVGFTGGINGAFKFADVWNFGVSASATVTYTSGTSVSGSENCPANIICGLTASAELLHVVGTMNQHTCGGTDDVYPCQYAASDGCTTGPEFNTDIPFTVDYPVVVSNSQVNGNDDAVVTFRACYVGTAIAGLDACPAQ